MRILIDMNLSPDWIEAFAAQGIESAHWSGIGDPHAKDKEIMDFARNNDYVVFTHDLDFGAILALTRSESPSVVQVRTQDTFPGHLAKMLISVLRENESAIERGALITVDESRARVRILPLQPRK